MYEEMLNNPQVNQLIELALAEDSGSGDVTSRALIPPQQTSRASIFAKEEGVLAGVDIAVLVFRRVEPALEVYMHNNDGREVIAGDRILSINGSSAAILKAERAALNFLGRLSGIASETARYVAEVKSTKAVIMDTRKTTPGMRLLEKYAVRMGGGRNHRLHLADGVLIKDNHLAVLRQYKMSLVDAVARAKHNAREGMKIEVEVNTIRQAAEAADAGADIIMLDNMPLEDMRQAVKQIADRAKLEASGGINLGNVRDVSMTGVDYISVGAITHSARSMDFSLEFEA